MLTIFEYRLPFGRRSKMEIWVVGRGGFELPQHSLRFYTTQLDRPVGDNWMDLLVAVNRKAARTIRTIKPSARHAPLVADI
jgi:hypothetical protein